MGEGAQRGDAGTADGGVQWSATPRELDDLEALLLGAYLPLRGFSTPDGSPGGGSGAASGAAVEGSALPLPPVRPTLLVSPDAARRARADGALDVLDEEGATVARVVVQATVPLGNAAAAQVAVVGTVLPASPIERGNHRALRRPAPGRASNDASVLVVPVERPLTTPEVDALRGAAERLAARVVLLPLVGQGRPRLVDGSALVRCCLPLRDELGADVVPVPVPTHGDPATDRALAVHVAAAYGATHVPGPVPAGALPPGIAVIDLPDAGADVLAAAERGEDPPTGRVPDVVLRELRRARRPGGGRGVTVLLSGLSGSGKSTIAKALHAAVLDRTDRTVTLLDGDVVRRMLSAGLTFSKADRELNVRRIGYVASEITRHGGLAICAPIAPYARTRAEVRAMVEEHGAFLLVHVATPLAVCEARDRKGLYAKARAGLIPSFTGVSDPYEEPVDADLRIDTAVTGIDESVDLVLRELTRRGWVVAGG